MSSSTSTIMNRPSTNNVETLVQSGKSVEQVIARDLAYPDLLTLLTGPTSDMYIKSLLSPTEDLLETNSVPIPPYLLQKIHEKHLDSRCFWGIFPEIGRAWLSIDHKLYIWNYSNPNEIYEYDDQDQIIISLGLIKPKAGIFENNITHLLVISTPLQIIILALSVSATDLKVFATEMVVPADDIQMRIIKGTDDGRIFMIGGGKPYEFKYIHPNSWGLGKKYWVECKSTEAFKRFLPTLPDLSSFVRRRKIEEPPQIKSLAIDDERKLLYLLTDTSIEVVDLGYPGNDYVSIFKHTTIIETAVQMCRQNSRSYSADAFTLVSAHVISKAESNKIHLMAITAAGFRLYFSTQKDAFRQTMVYNGDNLNLKSTTLEMGHVRLPPTDALQTNPGQPNSAIRYTYYDCGVCLSVKEFNEDIDSIYCSALAPSNIAPPTPQPAYSTIPSYNQPRPVYVETMSTTKTSTKVWSIAESRMELKGKRHMKEISEQISDAPRQFMALTSTSFVFYNKLRPVDVLLRIIQKEGRTQQEEQRDYEAFFGRYGKTESCAMCLSIICNTDNGDIIRKATRLFLELGGSPTSSTTAQTTGNHLGQVVGQTGITYSGRHDGFVLYLARLLTPVWKLKVFEKCNPSNPNASILCTKIQTLLYDVRCSLKKLKQFMDANPQFHGSANISDPRFQAADRSRLELDLAEQKSVRDMFLLLAQAIDAIYFIEFLLDSRMNTTFLPGPYDFNQLRTFFELDISSMIITGQGREVASDLAILTIGQYGNYHTHASFDIVSHQLEKSCSNFFGVKDIWFFKGMEHVKLARNAEVEYDRESNVKKSLSYFKEAADHISLQKMILICQFYLGFSYHVGIIELALERAHKLDPDNQAEAADESRSQDDAKTALKNSRRESYNFALESLNDLLLLKSQPFPQGRDPIQDFGIYYRNVIDTAIKSKDRLFHESLYAWFKEKGLQEELLSFETPYLVPYFKKNGDNDVSSLEFLWQYYRNKEHYMDSAVCLIKLAKSNSPSLNLKLRALYLTYASVNAKSEKEPQGREIEFTNYVKKMLDDSHLQLRVQEILRSNEGIDAQLAADRLDRELLDRVVLLQQYGTKFHFLEPVFRETPNSEEKMQ